MNTGRLIASILIASFLVAVAAVIAPQAAQAQCVPAGVPCPPPAGGGGGGEKKKRPTQTPVPTPKPTATTVTSAYVAPLPIAPAGGSAGSGQPGPNGSTSLNGGNELTVTKQPGPTGFSLLTNPWGLIGLLGGIIIVAFGGMYFYFRHGAGNHTLLGDTGGTMPGNTADGFAKFENAGQDLSRGMENGTLPIKDLSGNLENVTIARPDLSGNLQNATLGGKQVGGGIEMNTIGGHEIGGSGGNA